MMEQRDPDVDRSFALEDTIDIMEETRLCFHPVHHHSFSQVAFLLSGSVRICGGCDKRLHSVLGYEPDSSSQLVRCLACGVYSHRTCAMSTDVQLWNDKKCKVNTKRINREVCNEQENSGNEKESKEGDSEAFALDDVQSVDAKNGKRSVKIFHFLRRETSKANANEDTIKEEVVKSPPLPPPRLFESSNAHDKEASLVWTIDGPPDHWASRREPIDMDEKSQDVRTSVSAVSVVESSTQPNEIAEQSDNIQPISVWHPEPPVVVVPEQVNNQKHDANVNIAESSFANVAKAIQENVLAHFRSHLVFENTVDNSKTESEKDEMLPLLRHDSDSSVADCEERLVEKVDDPYLEKNDHSHSITKETRDALLQEVTPEPPPAKRSSFMRIASGSYEVAKTSSNLRKQLGMFSLVGGIAGGVAGLVMAGPAGAVLGAKWGQTCGVLSVVIEGSMTAVVLFAGVAAGSYTAKQIQHHSDRRIISMGEEGASRKVVLVRPHIWIDPAWELICENAIRGAPAVQTPGMFSMITGSKAKRAHQARNKRHQGDVDIVQAAECELPTDEKVLLLVSRILNDKLSLPGHVYRVLVEEHRKRSSARRLADVTKAIDDMERAAMNHQDDDDLDFCTSLEKIVRFRRLDAHAVIKHVTATLLEVRPGFASSPTITEMTATAVEGLVFGQLYDSVFEEIMEETKRLDEDLMVKLATFARDREDSLREMKEVSKMALHTLGQIPEAHTPVEKLRQCVIFLQQVSNHVSAPNQKALGADSLLKMVCLHLVAASVPFMNAEVVFLEEFARDERLLQGKEGYALVTLQASLHFLNNSNDFENDIFFVDDE